MISHHQWNSDCPFNPRDLKWEKGRLTMPAPDSSLLESAAHYFTPRKRTVMENCEGGGREAGEQLPFIPQRG